jgi:uncharacterized protein YkwD
MKRNVGMILTVVSLAALSACGGGSSGAAPQATIVQAPPAGGLPVTAVPADTAIVTSVPTPIYTPGPLQEELSAFMFLNAERSRCGFGLLAQNDQLDAAAKGHAEWLLTNNYTGHFQVSGTPLFTGVSPPDRMLAAGYSGSGGGNSTETEYDAGGTKSAQGIVGVRRLLNAPYHLMGMIRGFKDVGIAVRDKSDLGLPSNRHVVNIDYSLKSSAAMQAPAAGSLRTYPCAGSTLIDRSLSNETPSPVPGRNLGAFPLGSSVAIAIDVGHTLVISTASMVNAVTGAAVVVRAPTTSANDPNAVAGVSYLGSHEGFISADAPLDPKTDYKVTITGSDNGVAFKQPVSFTFTTGF